MFKPLLAALALLGTTGFAPAASADEREPSAVVEFQRGYPDDGGGLFTRADQEYLVLDNDDQSFRRAAIFGVLSRRESRTRSVPAGQRLTINAIVSYSEVSVGQCTGRAQFTPIAGHTYTVVQAELRPAVCEFRVTDVTTGAPPPDLEIVDDISGRAR